MIKRTKMKSIYISIAISVLFASCKVGKDYKRPALALPDQFRNAAAADSTSMAVLPAKDFFKDEALLALIDSARLKNYDLLIAFKSIEAANQTLKQAKVNFLPDLSAGIQVNNNRPSDNSLNGLSTSQFLGSSSVKDYNANINLSWEIDIWGRLRRLKGQAFAEYLESTEAAKAIRTQLTSGIATGYYNLLMLDAQLKIAKNTLALNDSTLRIIKLQWDAGQVTTLAVQQAEAQKQASELLVPQIEQGITVQENALSLLTGTLPGRISRTKDINEIQLQTDPAIGYPVALLQNRPDVKASEFALRAANEKAGVAQAGMYPVLNLTANGGLNSFKSSNWFNIPGSLFGTIAGSLTQPIFNRRQLKTQYEVAKIEREKSVLIFRQTVLTAVTEVSDALIKTQKLKTQVSIGKNRVNTLRSAISNAALLYSSGMATYLEVIVAQNNLLQSELELADLRRQNLVAAADLYRAIGGGIL